MTLTDTTATTISGDDLDQVRRANASGRTPVVFVHGLWLLPSSWQRWSDLFGKAGYQPVMPGWPDDPSTVEAARDGRTRSPDTGVGDIADHFERVIRMLDSKPAVIGHSFGGLLAEILAGRGLATACVAISPAPFRGVLPLPISALRSSIAVLKNPANRHRAVPLTYDQFRYAFANAVDEDEARQLYDAYSVPGSGEPIFQAAAANVNPWTEVKVDTANPDRGPLLIISADTDHTVPWAIANASYRKQRRNAGVTEIVKMEDRGHALTIDHGWRDVAETALAFVERFAPVA